MTPSAPVRELTLFDGLCLIVGIMIGAGIFESAPSVAQYSRGTAQLIAIWITGGVLSLLGACCYAGLARAYPESGGDYIFLKRAFGNRLSFIYAWTMLAIARPGNIGAMAYIFARYADQIVPLGPQGMIIYAVTGILALAALNLLGTRQGKRVQNFLTVVKVLGIALLVGIAFSLSSGAAAAPMVAGPASTPSLTLALIFVLFAYGGWNEIAFVAAEVKNPNRNLLLALIAGTTAVTVLYLIVNGAFLHALGFQGLVHADAAAHTVAAKGFPGGGTFVSVLIAISALGCANGMIFSGARIYYALGRDHSLFAPLGRWNSSGVPVWSIVTETLTTVTLMLLFSSSPSGFESLVLYTTPLYWVFLAMVAFCIYRLPKQVAQGVPGHPVSTLLFMTTCFFMLFMTLRYAYENVSWEIFWSLAILAIGVILGYIQVLIDKKSRKVL